ncbi:hypothetical protein E4T49_06117 [Aureobasidium sp. EXF-10728]|nr:hypothetical protein E4T49_06117 [Aureobasidium sp. EXF-10728]
MTNPNTKLQDVVHLDNIDDINDTSVGERIAEEKKLLKKIDMRMMPMMMLIYVLNYLDRNNIAVARLGSFEKDLGLQGTQYNTIISIFFVGYILTQVPTNMILDKVKPSVFLPFIMCCWGAVSACSGAVQNYHGRFVEAPFFQLRSQIPLPVLFMVHEERACKAYIDPLRGWADDRRFRGLLGSAIMGGIEGKAGLAAWRWLFIIEGTATIPVALAAAFVLPEYPDTTKWLTEQERQLAILRIAEDANEQDVHKSSSREGLKLAFADPSL